MRYRVKGALVGEPVPMEQASQVGRPSTIGGPISAHALMVPRAGLAPGPGPLWDWADANSDRDQAHVDSVEEAAVIDPRSEVWDWPSATKWAALDEVRELDGDNRPIVIGGQFANALRHTEVPDGASWSTLNSPTLTAADAVAPDGESDAYRIAFAAGGSGGQLRQSVADDPTGTVIYAVWLKQAILAAGASVNLFYRNSASTTVLNEAVTPGDEWTLYVRVLDNASSPTTPLWGLIENTDGAAFHVWGMGLYGGDFFQGYVRGTTASLLPPDDVVLSSGDVDAAFFAGAWSCTVTPMWDGADQVEDPAYIYWIDSDNYLAIVSGNTMRLRIGGSNFDRPVTPTAGTPMEVAVDFATGEMSVDGGSAVSLTGTWSVGNVRVGSAADGDGGGHLRGVVTIPFA